jgi:glycogen debranching enzyme
MINFPNFWPRRVKFQAVCALGVMYAVLILTVTQVGRCDPPAQTAPVAIAPVLTFDDRMVQSTLGIAYQNATDNLLRINTVPDTEKKHNAAGLMTGDPGLFVRAGGGYNEPWTRDASLNTWNAASLLEPSAARNTLWAVCQRDASGALIIQQDNQWWDKVIWITSAWHYYLVTGDRTFLTSAYAVAQDELSRMQRDHYSAEYGLFQGPAFFTDGIAGYPEPEYDPHNTSSFVLDHPYTSKLMALSTNCVYYNAYRCASQMATELGRPASEARGYDQSALALRAAINKHLWIPSKSTYGYFLHGAGPLTGRVDPTQEGIGISFAILFGVASPEQAASILQTVHRSPHGILTSWPLFPRFSDARPGRHNGVVWPLVNGMFACAAVQAGRTDLFQDEAENAALLAAASDHRFFEIYNGQTGIPDGGWQTGGHWPSQPDQTWSATAYLRMIYSGLFGMKFEPNSLLFSPTLPAEWGSVELTGVHYRAAVLAIALTGSGHHIARFLYDGKPLAQPAVPSNAVGPHAIVITLK